MALPTHGRIILETTVGEIDIELWSKVRPSVPPSVVRFTEREHAVGNTQDMSKLDSTSHGRYVRLLGVIRALC